MTERTYPFDCKTVVGDDAVVLGERSDDYEFPLVGYIKLRSRTQSWTRGGSSYGGGVVSPNDLILPFVLRPGRWRMDDGSEGVLIQLHNGRFQVLTASSYYTIDRDGASPWGVKPVEFIASWSTDDPLPGAKGGAA